MRRALKHAAEVLLSRGGAVRVARALGRRRALVLAYHNVVPDGQPPGGDLSLHISRGAFAAHLDLLARDHQVVPLHSLLSGSSAAAGRPPVAITFDDAYHGAVTAGVRELASRGMPATIFVAPRFLGGRSFWWDSFGDADDAGLAESFRMHALGPLRGEEEVIRRWAATHGETERPVPCHARAASEEDLREAVSHPGITLGSHTWSHPNLARLTPEEVREQLARPLVWLRERFGDAVIPVLAYPYGLSSSCAEQAAEAVGYSAGFRVEGGHLPEQQGNAFALPRLNVPSGLSAAGLALRSAGIFRA